jgi:hypothetical protein
MQREDLGEAHSDKSRSEYKSRGEYGIDDIDFESDDDDDDESGEQYDESGEKDHDYKSNFTDTELVDDPVFQGPSNPPTTSRINALLDECDGEWDGESVASCSPPHREWMGGRPNYLYG